MTAPTVTTILSDNAEIRILGRMAGRKPLPLTVTEFQPFDIAMQVPLAVTRFEPQTGDFVLRLPRQHGADDRVYRRFLVQTAPQEGAAQPLSGPCQVSELSGAPFDYPFPTSSTIKGLQVRVVEDALELGVGHAALNLNMGNILCPGPGEGRIPYEHEGKTYYFDDTYLREYDQSLRELSDHGIVVTLILLNAPRWHDREIDPALRPIFLHPTYHPEGIISAFNVTNPESLGYFKAFIAFTAQRYTRPDQKYGRACGFILGNEVDSQWMWGNAGEMAVTQYIREYAIALRTAFYAARSQYAQARMYISLDHLWTRAFNRQSRRFYKGKEILDGLNDIFRAEGDFEWALAYHPYPEDLSKPAFWHDKTATRSFETKRITFKNLAILTEYLRQPHFLWQGKQRNVILSEQGFHSDETPEGEELQAAAYAFAYWKVKNTPGIDSFILHAHVDHRDEFGLNLGIWRRDKTSADPSQPGTPKPIHVVFKGVDGPDAEAIFARARRIVGKRNWK